MHPIVYIVILGLIYQMTRFDESKRREKIIGMLATIIVVDQSVKCLQMIPVLQQFKSLCESSKLQQVNLTMIAVIHQTTHQLIQWADVMSRRHCAVEIQMHE